MICDELPGATVLGLQRPVHRSAARALEALTIGELDQVILHEHAHVQRRDDWLRLVQTLLLSALWVHPAALFVSRALNREREMACDEWVVARTGSPKAYARCLARAAEVRGRMKAQSALVPALFGTRHDLRAARRSSLDVERPGSTEGIVRRCDRGRARARGELGAPAGAAIRGDRRRRASERRPADHGCL